MDVEVLVVGAGVVGVACARALALDGRDVVVIDRRDAAGRETTSRSSEVVHAGLYYPAGSWKARLCVAGNAMLWELAARRGLPARRLGKLVVATRDEDVARLEELRRRGRAAGAPGLELVSPKRVAALEPRVRAVAALWSPSSGIVDSHALVRLFESDARGAGAAFAYHTALRALEPIAGGWRVATRDATGAEASISCRVVVNAAGLEADRVAALAGLDVAAEDLLVRPVKGSYFAVGGASARGLAHLVYPLPSGPGLGIHVTLDLGGRVRLGPDAEPVTRPAPGVAYDLSVDPAARPRFVEAVRRYLPDVDDADVAPDQAGVRPRLGDPAQPARDFVIREESERGLAGLVDLIGIDSPGLTASPAIGAEVASLVGALLA